MSGCFEDEEMGDEAGVMLWPLNPTSLPAQGPAGGEQAVTEVWLPMGAGVMGGSLQGWVLVGHWPCSARLALLGVHPALLCVPLALLNTQGAGGMT